MTNASNQLSFELEASMSQQQSFILNILPKYEFIGVSSKLKNPYSHWVATFSV